MPPESVRTGEYLIALTLEFDWRGSSPLRLERSATLSAATYQRIQVEEREEASPSCLLLRREGRIVTQVHLFGFNKGILTLYTKNQEENLFSTLSTR